MTVEQKHFEDQGGTVKWRERFTGGTSTRASGPRRYGAVKAVDPLTGETKAQFKMQYPNWGGTLATAGNLVFNGAIDGGLPHSTPRPCRSSGPSTPAPASTPRPSPTR